MLELTVRNVETVFKECLFTDDELDEHRRPKPGLEIAEARAVVHSFGFNKARLETRKEEIRQLLSQLPANFREGVGEGWSFLNACLREDGTQWGEHVNIEQLLALGIATEQAKILMPREMWSIFPGGVPYFSVKV